MTAAAPDTDELRQLDADRRRAAVVVAGSVGTSQDRGLVKVLLEVLRENDVDLRLAAIDALGRLHVDEALPALAELAHEPLANTVAVPFFKNVLLDLGWFFIPFGVFVMVGASNAVNLTDGLDGLAAGCAAIVLLAYIGITFFAGDYDMAMLAGCLVGACIGFLWFNAFPATIFMGDTGSLGLGGAIAGLAVMTKTELLLVLIGGIFVVEALSVLIQVISFQTTRKRVFLMAPIHHHFELQGWSETKIILRFWIVAAVWTGPNALW